MGGFGGANVAGVGRAGLVKGAGVEENGGSDKAEEKREAAVGWSGGTDFRPRHGARRFPAGQLPCK